MLPPKHPAERARLKTLWHYDILDTEAEDDFDDIVALASEICEAPVSLISLVDQDRQWFKARKGFEATETPLDQSVCAHAILEESFLEIPDMSADMRTRDNALHTGGPKVQFYAGANLRAPNGMPIGTLCVLDKRPRQLTEFQREALKTLSRHIVTQLELRKKLQQEAELRKEADHRVANSLQTISSLLRLSSAKLEDPQAVAALDMVDRRLNAVQSLHGELMERDSKGQVRADTYLGRLASFLSDICPPGVSLKVESVEVELGSGPASALGMIANEFVANSLKYAFGDDQSGEISITLREADREQLELRCTDTGGAPTTKAGNPPDGTGIGTKIIEAAASQLQGRLSHEIGRDGAALIVRFPRE